MKTLTKHLMVAAAMALGSTAYAIPTLVIFDGTTTILVVDGGPGDAALATPGAVSFVGSIGTWSLTVDTGVSKPLIGSATSPEMDLSYSATSTSAGGFLSIKFSDTGFNAVGGIASNIGGTLSGGSSVTGIVGLNGSSVASSGTFSSPSFSSDFGGAVSLSPSDVFSLEVDISSPAGARTTSSGDFYVTVPDGGTTALLLGLGLVGMSAAAVRRKKA